MRVRVVELYLALLKTIKTVKAVSTLHANHVYDNLMEVVRISEGMKDNIKICLLVMRVFKHSFMIGHAINDDSLLRYLRQSGKVECIEMMMFHKSSRVVDKA